VQGVTFYGYRDRRVAPTQTSWTAPRKFWDRCGCGRSNLQLTVIEYAGV
jgi:hypothetical protein